MPKRNNFKGNRVWNNQNNPQRNGGNNYANGKYAPKSNKFRHAVTDISRKKKFGRHFDYIFIRCSSNVEYSDKCGCVNCFELLIEKAILAQLTVQICDYFCVLIT